MTLPRRQHGIGDAHCGQNCGHVVHAHNVSAAQN
jgi:hypothetical protein